MSGLEKKIFLYLSSSKEKLKKKKYFGKNCPFIFSKLIHETQM